MISLGSFFHVRRFSRGEKSEKFMLREPNGGQDALGFFETINFFIIQRMIGGQRNLGFFLMLDWFTRFSARAFVCYGVSLLVYVRLVLIFCWDGL